MKLIIPNEKLLENYRDAVIESFDNNIEEWKPFDPSNYAEWKKTILDIYKKVEIGKNLPKGAIKTITYWCVEGDELIGEVQIRPTLTAKLEYLYGHISYAIKYSKWGNGYGSKALQLALEESKKLELEKVNIVCRVANIGSNRVIEKNKGKLISINEENPDDIYNVYEINVID